MNILVVEIPSGMVDFDWVEDEEIRNMLKDTFGDGDFEIDVSTGLVSKLARKPLKEEDRIFW